MVVNLLNGVHEGIRTPDRTLRRRVLYPAELRRHYLLSTAHLYYPSLEVITIFFRTTFKSFLSICRFYRLFLYF